MNTYLYLYTIKILKILYENTLYLKMEKVDRLKYSHFSGKLIKYGILPD